MVKKMLEVVVNSLYPALTTVKTDWLFLCTPDSVISATSRPFHPPLPTCSRRDSGQPLQALMRTGVPHHRSEGVWEPASIGSRASSSLGHDTFPQMHT